MTKQAISASRLAPPAGRWTGKHRRPGKHTAVARRSAADFGAANEQFAAQLTVIIPASLVHTGVPSRPLTGTLAGHGAGRLPIIAVSVSIMLLVIATGEVLLHLVGVRPTPTPPPIEAAAPAPIPRGRHERRSPPTQGVPAGRP